MSDKNEKKPAEQPVVLTAEAIKELMQAQSATVLAALQQSQQGQRAVAPQHISTYERCSECRQYTKACGGKHVEAVVIPDRPRMHKWFKGVQFNGVMYRSDGPGHRIVVPEVGLHDILGAVSKWEENEEIQEKGRVVNRHIGHGTNHGVTASEG
jgi:hypothetical protein